MTPVQRESKGGRGSLYSGWRVREEVTTSKAAAAAASLLALFWMCVEYNKVHY
jgi:hypothetical protein